MELLGILFPEYRLNWFDAGPSSPNKTGALLAILFIAAWWPALRFRWGFWLSLPLAFVAAGLLLQTASRGALVGVIVAGLVVGCVRFRPWLWLTPTLFLNRFPLRRKATEDSVNTLQWRLNFSDRRTGDRLSLGSVARWLLGGAAIAVLLFYSHQLGVNDRMTGMASGEDESANVRVALYSAGLAMVHAAPMGWGAGQAGDVYGQWYQAIGDGRSYLSLVNSHLTWMSDFGMLFQLVYIVGWCVVLLLCWPVPWTPLRAIAFGCWIVLGVCGLFSSVLTLPWLWVLPGILLVLVVAQRLRMRMLLGWEQCRLAVCLGLAGFIGVQALGFSMTGALPIRASVGMIQLGATPEAVLIVAPDRRVLGDKYGHTLREDLDAIGGATILRSVEAWSDIRLSQYATVVFSGALPDVSMDGFEGRIVLLNPSGDVESSVLDQWEDYSVTVVVGSLGDWRRARLWQVLAEERTNVELIQLRGVADFVPNWTRFLLNYEL